MKRNVILSCLMVSTMSAVMLLSSCVPGPRRPPGLVILPGAPRGPGGVPKPKVRRPPRPYVGAVWVEPVYHWDGTRWIVKKNGYWVKPKNTPPGKAKGHNKNKKK